MVPLLFQSVSQYTSPIYEIARNVLRSRNNQVAKGQRLVGELEETRRDRDELATKLQRAQAELEETRRRLEQQENRTRDLEKQPQRLPSDLPLKHHSFGPALIAVCINLSNQIGFRPTETALKIVFKFLGILDKVPSWSTIRLWSCRLGVSLLQEPVEAADDWIWLVDHSNQIGQHKILQILGIRASDLPSPGETLPLEKMRVLAVAIKTSWAWNDVREEYQKLARRIGTPRYVITDGAKELWETVDVLQKPGKEVIVLRDFKHFAANVFEKLIGKSERFVSFRQRWGQTRSAVQQTELGCFTPPAQKETARFMNLGPTIRWASMVSYHLSHPQSKARQGITASRMNEKLGWVRDYRADLRCWTRCQQVLQTALRLINRLGLSVGQSQKLKEELERLRVDNSWDCETSTSMANQLVAFVHDEESKLAADERTWLSTENLESAFGQFKRLERQHSKGGFTSLASAMPTVLCRWTSDRVRQLLPKVTTKQLNSWVQQELGCTLGAKRKLAYRESAAQTG